MAGPRIVSGAGRTTQAPSQEAILGALDRILASQVFSRSDRHRRFLSYLVHAVLQGRAQELTESRTAVEIFNRKPSFDPNIDPIVRVEAGRLRRRLREYYESEGSSDPVVIDLPQRTYIPAFRSPDSDVLESEPPKKSTRRRIILAAAIAVAVGLTVLLASSMLSTRNSPPPPAPVEATAQSTIVVLPLFDFSPNKSEGALCDTLTEELIDALTETARVRVVSRMSSFQYKSKAVDIRQIGRDLNVDLAMEGSVRRSGDDVQIVVDLVNVSDGYPIWSKTFRRNAKTAGFEHELSAEAAELVRKHLDKVR